MKKNRLLAAILASLLAISVLAGCSNTENPIDGTDSDSTDTSVDSSNEDTSAEDTVPVYVPEENPYTRPEETYEGVQGIMLRTDAVPEAGAIEGTQITDVVIPADSVGPIGKSKANVWLSVDVTKADDAALAAVDKALSVGGIYGIELDFVGMESEAGADYLKLSAVNDFVAKVSEKADAKGDIKVSAVVYGDIYTNYDFGLDVSNWVSNGYIDAVSPSSASGYVSTDIPIRLWSSLVDPFGVTIAPVIDEQIKVSESAEAYANTAQTLAGCAALYLSQGADKLCVGDWVSADMLSVIGSYETVMKTDRMHVLTNTLVARDWRNPTKALPKTVSGGSTATLRLHIGNIPEDAEIVLELTVKNMNDVEPTIYLNSQLCESLGAKSDNPNIRCYKVPADAYDDGHLVLEIMMPRGSIVIDNIAAFVDVK